jgi:lipase chaperone LimK
MPAAIPTAADEASKPFFIEYVEPTLRADAEGHLILDSEARNAFEILIGMSARELGQRQQRLVQQLPAVAAAQALDLLQRLSDYRSAAVQTFPRENPPANLDQARSMLSTLHQLRVDYLGEPAALALFQSEERAARRFIEALTPSAAANAGAADDARTTLVLHVVFGMYIVPRQPPRPLDSRTRDAASRGSTNISNSSKPPSTEWAIGSSQSSS